MVGSVTVGHTTSSGSDIVVVVENDVLGLLGRVVVVSSSIASGTNVVVDVVAPVDIVVELLVDVEGSTVVVVVVVVVVDVDVDVVVVLVVLDVVVVVGSAAVRIDN